MSQPWLFLATGGLMVFNVALVAMSITLSILLRRKR